MRISDWSSDVCSSDLADEVEGLKAYPSLADTPDPIDYAYVAVGAPRIPDALGDARGRCRIAQVISSGFGGLEEGRDLQALLVQKARECRVLVFGPTGLGPSFPPRRHTRTGSSPCMATWCQ